MLAQVTSYIQKFIMADSEDQLMPICFAASIAFYAGIAMQVLQYLREFDAPAMQSCKPLP